MSEVIPGPKGLPLIGNLLDLRSDEGTVMTLGHLADTYGPVFQIHTGGKRTLVVASAEVMKELVDEKRFVKTPPPALQLGKGPFGLFAAKNEDPDWGQAHRILMPAFGPLSVEVMFDGMKDLANQLVLKWARKGSDHKILVTDDYTRLTLDTIALCTMDYRFNSFYQDGMHPFVDAMLHVLEQNGVRSSQPWWLTKAMLYISPETDTKASAAYMGAIAQGIIQHRRSNPKEEPDFLATLLEGKDPKTGQRMRDELIAAEMITFLVAGHETTSGLLSFATMFLLQHPETLRKAQEEVDTVTHGANITIEHLKRFKYIEAVLRETLRLCPTAPALSKSIPPHRQHEYVTLMDGRFHVENDDRVAILLSKCMQDPKVFGETANQFRPERMLEDNPDWKSFQQYWRPFGNGQRACIGRAFALQEAVLAIATILQNFDLKLVDPSYKMKIKQTLTIKPANLYIKATLRPGLTATTLDQKLHNLQADGKAIRRDETTAADEGEKIGLTILYGSNTGTCQALAQKLASEVSSSYGIGSDVQSMDYRLDRLSTETPTIIITASYEGEPPDNAVHFVNWLEHLNDKALDGVKYAVFGVGHSDWANTFHRIPNLLNDAIEACGGRRMAEIGLCDVSKGSASGDFEAWLDQILLPVLNKELESSSIKGREPKAAEAHISTGSRATTLRHDVAVGTVKSANLLTADGEPPKHHIEISLPPGSEYEGGDYLAILPQNPELNVRKVMAHFSLPLDSTITLTSPSFSPLPLNIPLSVSDLLYNYVELAQPATKRALITCAKHSSDTDFQAKVSALTSDDTAFTSCIIHSRTSIFDIRTKYPSINLPFATFLSLLLPLSVRQYSISSSPLSDPSTCTLTYGVISSTTPKTTTTADNEREFLGVTSNYLASLKPGDKIQCSVRRTAKATFRLPLDMESTPLLMFCAGTGLAPFRGFIQQRAVQLEANPNLKLAPAIIFIGCRSSTKDRLYASEMDAWASKGAVTLKYAFSAEPEKSSGCKHVDQLMMYEHDLIVSTWRDGARVYVCGSRCFAESVTTATKAIVEKALVARMASGETIDAATYKAIEDRIRERAASDIFD